MNSKEIVIFFDLFDTLISADRGYLEPYFNREIDRLGDKGILKNSEDTIKEIVSLHPELLLKHTIDEMSKYYKNCMSSSLKNVQVSVLNMLKYLKDNDYKLCIISDAAFVDILDWEGSPLSRYFDKTVFSCNVGYTKPDIRLFETAKQFMGSPSKCVFVGDGGHEELTGAKNANMITIKAGWLKERKDLSNQYADYCINSLDELVKVITNVW